MTHQHVTNKGIDCYLSDIGLMEVRPDRYKKKSFFLSSSSDDTTIGIHYIDANKTYGEKARRQLHKNAVSNSESSWSQHSKN